MIQSETERQFYLAMAGVQLWYARDDLPGAAPSPDYVFFETEGVPGAAKASVDNLDEPINFGGAQRRSVINGDVGNVPGKPDLKALMGHSSATQAEPLPVVDPRKDNTSSDDDSAQETVIDALTMDVQEPVKLSVQAWVGRRSAMIASLSSEVSSALQETLALNILRSLGETDTCTLGAIHWPVFNNRLVPGSSLADLGSVMSHAISGLEDQRLLVLGVDDNIVGRALAAGEPKNNRQKIIFPHSLSEMAANPVLKRELWCQIKSMAD